MLVFRRLELVFLKVDSAIKWKKNTVFDSAALRRWFRTPDNFISFIQKQLGNVKDLSFMK
jgi:hypothetical protein